MSPLAVVGYYEPWWVQLGLAISVATLIAVSIGLVVLTHGRRTPPEPFAGS